MQDVPGTWPNSGQVRIVLGQDSLRRAEDKSSGGSEVCGKGFNIQLEKTKGGGKKEVINTKKEVPTSGDLCR